MGRINNVHENINGGRGVIPPALFRKDINGSRMNLACFLRVIGHYNQSESYRLAYDYKGTPASLASTSSRYFASAEVKNCCLAFAEYYSENQIKIKNSHLLY